MGPIRRPRYFHLLWDEDLDELRDVLKRMRDRRSEVVARWYELYLLHFGDERTLTEPEFRDIFEPALLRNQDALLCGDMDGYAASVLMIGRQLAERLVPLDELIAAVHLLEEAAQAVFPRNRPPSMEIFNKFDKLSHIRIILLVSAYCRTQSASAATRISALELEAKTLRPQERTRFHGLLGQTPVMRELYQQIEAAAQSAAPVLIVGEAGAGKETAARAVHECARAGPFVALRLETLPESMVENELFGYVRQTGNEAQNFAGLFGAAEGGTLFLKEICRMPPNVQGKLARTLIQTGHNSPQGKVRIVASTSHEPQEALRMGRLGEHLSRLFEGQVLRAVPLRERRADIAILTRHFIDLLNHRMIRETPIAGIDDAATELMDRYPWPGNVRQLLDTIENAFLSARSGVIGPADLPAAISGINGQMRRLPTIAFETFADAERAVLQRALEITGGNKLRAAKLLKISRKKLYSGIAKYGLKPAQV
jgi:DNA-binding NtrC family response regulator